MRQYLSDEYEKITQSKKHVSWTVNNKTKFEHAKELFNTLTAEGFRDVGHFMSLKNHVFMSW